jgi:hypothetical protein
VFNHNDTSYRHGSRNFVQRMSAPVKKNSTIFFFFFFSTTQKKTKIHTIPFRCIKILFHVGDVHFSLLLLTLEFYRYKTPSRHIEILFQWEGGGESQLLLIFEFHKYKRKLLRDIYVERGVFTSYYLISVPLPMKFCISYIQAAKRGVLRSFFHSTNYRWGPDFPTPL